MGSLKDLSGLDWVQESDILDRLYDSPYMSFQGGTIDDVIDWNDPLIKPTFDEHSLIDLAPGYHGVYRGELQTPRAKEQAFKKREKADKRGFNGAYEQDYIRNTIASYHKTYTCFISYYKGFLPYGRKYTLIQKRIIHRHLQPGWRLLQSFNIEDNRERFYEFPVEEKKKLAKELDRIISDAFSAANSIREIEQEHIICEREADARRERELRKMRERNEKQKRWRQTYQKRLKERRSQEEERQILEDAVNGLRPWVDNDKIMLERNRRILEKQKALELEREKRAIEEEYQRLRDEVDNKCNHIDDDILLDITSDLEEHDLTMCDWYQTQLEMIRLQTKGKEYRFQTLLERFPIAVVRAWADVLFQAIVDSGIIQDVHSPYEAINDALINQTLSVDDFYRKLSEMIYTFNQLSLSLQWLPSSDVYFTVIEIYPRIRMDDNFITIRHEVRTVAELFVDLYNHNILQNMHKMGMYPIENRMMPDVYRGHKAFAHLVRGPEGIDVTHWSW